MKSIVKIIKFREVMIAIEKPIRFAVKRTCLAEYNKKLGFFILVAVQDILYLLLFFSINNIESKEKLEYLLLDMVYILISKT